MYAAVKEGVYKCNVFTGTYWDSRLCIWRNPDDNMQRFYTRSLVTNPLLDPRRLLVTKDKTPKERCDGFKVVLDVYHFKGDEIVVSLSKVDETHIIVVEGRHDDRIDEHGFIERHFVRTFVLPSNCNIDRVKSNWTLDGLLTISVPKIIEDDDESTESDESASETSKSSTSATQQTEGNSNDSDEPVAGPSKSTTTQTDFRKFLMKK